MKFDVQIESVLQNLEKSSGEFWNISRETGEFLYEKIIELGMTKKMAGEKEGMQILEIGTSNGYSGIWFAKALSDIAESLVKGRLITIESHQDRFDLAKKNFELAGLSEWIVQVKGHAPEILDNLKLNSLDFVFLDATKKQYMEIFNKIAPAVRVGGLIVADNIRSHWEILEPFVSEVMGSRGFESGLVELGTGLLISKKIEA